MLRGATPDVRIIVPKVDASLHTDFARVPSCVPGVAVHSLQHLPALVVGPRLGNQPSAIRPMRSKTGSTPPPIHSGMGRCTGMGFSPAAVMLCQRPEKVTTSSVHRARSTETCSSMRRPRLRKLSPSASYSHPVPPDADAKADAPAREDVHRGCLLGNQGRLPLRQDDDAGYHLKTHGDAREVAEEDEGFVNRLSCV